MSAEKTLLHTSTSSGHASQTPSPSFRGPVALVAYLARAAQFTLAQSVFVQDVLVKNVKLLPSCSHKRDIVVVLRRRYIQPLTISLCNNID